MRPTIKSIAQALDLSHATVSMALRDHPLINQDTKARVKAAAAKAGYIPNGIAQAMRQSKTSTLGVIVNSMSLSFTGMIVDAIEQSAREHGYQCLLCQTHGDPLQMEQQIRVLIEQRAAGLIIHALNFKDDASIYGRAVPPGIPCVLYDGEVPGFSASAVVSDSLAIGFLATRHLLDLGHRRIACVQGPPQSRNATDRMTGYRAALKAARIRFDPALLVPGGWGLPEGQAAAKELLRRKCDFTAVVAPADSAAVGVMKTLLQAGRRVPDEVSIVGAGNCDFTELVTPQLTSIEQYPSEIGRNALKLLMKKIDKGDRKHQCITIAPAVVRRESTARK